MLKDNGSRASARSKTLYYKNPTTVTILVGAQKEQFTVSKKLLASSSSFFRKNLQVSSLWLEDQCPEMFELFLHWLYERNDFQQHIDEAEANNCCEDLHDDLINLHLFAAQIELAPLQDIAMDAIQDIYLRCNWDIRPRLVSYIYTECSPIHSCRIRKWIVAMTAWSLGGDLEQSATGGKMEVLFQKFPDFWADYVSHLSKTSKNRIKLHFKNPQLRLPTNNLRNEERHFGFRQCSFHTHRSSVGQGKCPHTLAQQQYRAESPVSSEYSDSSSPGLIFPEDMVSPRTAIFDLYLATP